MARTWRTCKALDSLRDEVNERWPKRAKVSDGTIGDAAHSARESDHNPDSEGVVRAIDITEWDPGTPADESDDVAEVVAETLRALKDPRIKYVIWRGRMFASYSRPHRAAWEWGPYTGPNGHFKHVHVSFVAGAAGDTAGPFGLHTTQNPPPQEDDDMNDHDRQLLAATNLGVQALLKEVVASIDANGNTRMDRLAADVARASAFRGEVRSDLRKLLAAFDADEPSIVSPRAQVVALLSKVEENEAAAASAADLDHLGVDPATWIEAGQDGARDPIAIMLGLTGGTMAEEGDPAAGVAEETWRTIEKGIEEGGSPTEEAAADDELPPLGEGASPTGTV